MKYFVLIGEGYPTLKIAHLIHSHPNARLSVIFTNIDSDEPLVEFSNKNHIKLRHVEDLRVSDTIQWLDDINADWLINILSPIIIPAGILDLFSDRALNLHTGPLPNYAGMHVHQWGIRNGETSFSATIHQMESEVDTGNIVAVSHFKINPNDTGLSLFNKVINSGVKLLHKVLLAIIKGDRISGHPQNLLNRHYYHPKDALNSAIDWRHSASTIVNFIRAGNYKPFTSPTYTATLDNIVIFKAEIGEKVKDIECGQLIELTAKGPRISCSKNESVILLHAEIDLKRVDLHTWKKYFKTS
jgi:methionyl-tRNA formyltransferase